MHFRLHIQCQQTSRYRMISYESLRSKVSTLSQCRANQTFVRLRRVRRCSYYALALALVWHWVQRVEIMENWNRQTNSDHCVCRNGLIHSQVGVILQYRVDCLNSRCAVFPKQSVSVHMPPQFAACCSRVFSVLTHLTAPNITQTKPPSSSPS